MKIKFLALLAIIFCSIQTMAQLPEIGVKAGVNINKLSGKSFKDEFSFGYHAGAYTSIKFTKYVGLQPEILFSQINVDTASSLTTIYHFSNANNLSLQYLTIPILLNIYPTKLICIQVGPQYGLLLNQSNSLLTNGKNAFKSGDFSLLGGVQLNVKKLKIYARYAIGLSNINDIDNKDAWKNQTIQAGIGFKLF